MQDYGLGFRVSRLWGLGLTVQGSGLGLGFRIWGFGFLLIFQTTDKGSLGYRLTWKVCP